MKVSVIHAVVCSMSAWMRQTVFAAVEGLLRVLAILNKASVHAIVKVGRLQAVPKINPVYIFGLLFQTADCQI